MSQKTEKASLTENHKEFLNEVFRAIGNVDKALAENLSKESIKISPEGFSIFRTALLDCKAALVIFEGSKENEKWRKLYKNHEQWKKMAIEDPLTSDWLKGIIRSNTKTKRVYQVNSLSTELARCLKDSLNYLSKHEIRKKEAAQFLVLGLLKQCFPESPALDGITEEVFKKAMQRV